jgi:hypothetical protein
MSKNSYRTYIYYTKVNLKGKIMADYSLKLTPDLVNPGSEGSLDTSVVNGVSIQRTVNMLDVLDAEGNRKVISLKDGDSFDDVVSGTNDSDV